MIKVYLIRHGEAIDGWTSLDPVLSKRGRKQAEELKLILKDKLTDKIDIISSPLSRCQETASISVKESKKEITIDDVFRELPSPVESLDRRVIWLKRVLPLDWEDLEQDTESKLSNINYHLWREKIISKILSFKSDTVIFTHFVVINNVIGKIMKSTKVVNFYPENCSITEIGIENNKIELIKLGNSSVTKVN
ncbi:MAG: histidine phosphatase family protein [Pseudomonadota bacterium]|nr:histidine phosphatase family protein [Pseudomonadota bacterium]